jgi:hypothetical protein
VRFERFRSVGPGSVLDWRLSSRIENSPIHPLCFLNARAIEMGNGVVSRHRARRSSRWRPPSGAGVFNFGQGKDNLNVTLSAPAVCKCLGLAVVDSLWDFDDDPSLTEGDSLKLWAVTRTFSHLAEAKCGLRWVSRRSRTTERDLIPCLCGRTIITWDGTFVYADHNVTHEPSDIASKIRLPPVKM